MPTRLVIERFVTDRGVKPDVFASLRMGAPQVPDPALNGLHGALKEAASTDYRMGPIARAALHMTGAPQAPRVAAQWRRPTNHEENILLANRLDDQTFAAVKAIKKFHANLSPDQFTIAVYASARFREFLDPQAQIKLAYLMARAFGIRPDAFLNKVREVEEKAKREPKIRDIILQMGNIVGLNGGGPGNMLWASAGFYAANSDLSLSVPLDLAPFELPHNLVGSRIAAIRFFERVIGLTHHIDALMVNPGGLGTAEELGQVINPAVLGEMPWRDMLFYEATCNTDQPFHPVLFSMIQELARLGLFSEAVASRLGSHMYFAKDTRQALQLVSHIRHQALHRRYAGNDFDSPKNFISHVYNAEIYLAALQHDLNLVKNYLNYLEPATTVGLFGAAAGVDDEHAPQLKELAKALLRQGKTILYMATGQCAQAIEDALNEVNSGFVVRIKNAADSEVTTSSERSTELPFLLSDTAITSMLNHSGAGLVFFPNGLHLFDAFFEAMTRLQTKKIAPRHLSLFGDDKYWTPVFKLLDTFADFGTIKSEDRNLATRCRSVDDVTAYLSRELPQIDSTSGVHASTANMDEFLLKESLRTLLARSPEAIPTQVDQRASSIAATLLAKKPKAYLPHIIIRQYKELLLAIRDRKKGKKYLRRLKNYEYWHGVDFNRYVVVAAIIAFNEGLISESEFGRAFLKPNKKIPQSDAGSLYQAVSQNPGAHLEDTVPWMRPPAVADVLEQSMPLDKLVVQHFEEA